VSGETVETDEPDSIDDAKPEEQDPEAAKEEVAAEMEFWLDDVLPDSVDCAKCGNSLKLDGEEKMFGMYQCPYCKADIGHAKGTVVESLASIRVGEEEEEEIVKKRKPINFKALLPYAAVLVFAAALNYTVLWVTNYLQERKAHKAQWVSQLKAEQSDMKERPGVYHYALEDEENKAAFERVEEMSLDELKAFSGRLIKEKEGSEAKWFEDKGDEITTNSDDAPVVQGFQRKLNRFIRWVQLAKIDAENLEMAIGMNSSERRKAQQLIKAHVASIREQMGALSADEAIELGLVRLEVLTDLMKISLEVDNFQFKSVKQAVVQLTTMTELARAMEDQYRFSQSAGGHADESHHDVDHTSHAQVRAVTPWNAKVFHWRKINEMREQDHQTQWIEIVAGYGHLMDLFSSFHNQLETLKGDPNLSRFQHPFLEGGVLALRVDEFRELEGVGDLVSHNVESRLERLVGLLDPYIPGSLGYDLKSKKTSGQQLTHDQVNELYERFWDHWQQFHLEKQWFELEGISSYYHFSRIGAHGSHNSAGEHH